jgi:hypothetical protein
VTAVGRGWLVSPAFDLLFLANLGWLAIFVPGVATRTDTAVDFWQVYFITLPHRWLTLVLVAADPDRRAGIQGRLAAAAGLALLLVVGLFVSTGTFVCLAMVDFVWNAWHFGAQHAGVLRMYSRKVGGGPDWLERWGIRLFVTYVLFRTADWVAGWASDDPVGAGVLRVTDLGMLAMPAVLLANTVCWWTRERIGKAAYTASVCGLYTSLLLAVSFQVVSLVLVLTTAAALFHATEYLAVVTHYAWRRDTVGSAGAFRHMARHWLAFLAVYAVALGTVGTLLDRKGSGLYELWLGANLWAALTHYAFDGMIWKLRRPETARALGV